PVEDLVTLATRFMHFEESMTSYWTKWHGDWMKECSLHWMAKAVKKTANDDTEDEECEYNKDPGAMLFYQGKKILSPFFICVRNAGAYHEADIT
ncbi:hypothetical protein ACJX0J_022513, partial [Zea mays]